MRTGLAASFACGLAVLVGPLFVVGQPPKPSATVELEGRSKRIETSAALMPEVPVSLVGLKRDFQLKIAIRTISGITIIPTPPRDADQYAILGVRRGSRLEYLTWERVYALALVRYRAAGARNLAAMLYLAEADERTTPARVRDFARFRADFLERPARADAATFVDPSADYWKVLYQLRVVDNAWANVTFHANLEKVIGERVHGELSGLGLLDLELVHSSLVEARNHHQESVAEFRDQLDELKVTLGLSPSAAVFPDRSSTAIFGDVASQVDDWVRSTENNPAMLPKLAERFPPLGDVTIEGEPILGKIAKNPEPLEELLAKAVEVATRGAGDAAKPVDAEAAETRRELSIRRRVRRLSDMRARYAVEKQSYVRIWRLKQHAFDRMVAPVSAAPLPRSEMLAKLVAQQAELLKTENRLVRIWTSFQAERLALYRDIGVFPYASWNAFYESLVAPRPVAEPRVKVRELVPEARP